VFALEKHDTLYSSVPKSTGAVELRRLSLLMPLYQNGPLRPVVTLADICLVICRVGGAILSVYPVGETNLGRAVLR